MARERRSPLLTVAIWFSVLSMVHTQTALRTWEDIPYAARPNTPDRIAYVTALCAVDRAFVIAAGVVWALVMAGVVVRGLRERTIKSVLLAILSVVGLVILMTSLEMGAMEPAMKEGSAYLASHPRASKFAADSADVLPAQWACLRFHSRTVGRWVIFPTATILLLLSGLFLVLLGLSIMRRLRGRGRSEEPPYPLPQQVKESLGDLHPSAEMPPRRSWFIQGFLALHWVLSLVWVWQGECHLLTGLSLWLHAKDPDYHLYLRNAGYSEHVVTTWSVLSIGEFGLGGTMLLGMTPLALVLIIGLRRRGVWSRVVAMRQAALLIVALNFWAVARIVDDWNEVTYRAVGYEALKRQLEFAFSMIAGHSLPGLFLAFLAMWLWLPRVALGFRSRKPSAKADLSSLLE